MEKKMETTIVYRGYIALNPKPRPASERTLTMAAFLALDVRDSRAAVQLDVGFLWTLGSSFRYLFHYRSPYNPYYIL